MLGTPTLAYGNPKVGLLRSAGVGKELGVRPATVTSGALDAYYWRLQYAHGDVMARWLYPSC